MPRKQKQSRATPPWAMQAQPQLTTLYDAKGRALLVSLHGGAPHLAGLTVGKRRRPVRIAGMEDAASEASSRRSHSRRASSVGSVRSRRSAGSTRSRRGRQSAASRPPGYKLRHKLKRLARAAAAEGKWGAQHEKELAEAQAALAKAKAQHGERTGTFYYSQGEWPQELEASALASHEAAALHAAVGKLAGVYSGAQRDTEREKRRLGPAKRLALFNGLMTEEQLKPHRHFLKVLHEIVRSGKPLRLHYPRDFTLVVRALMEKHSMYRPGIVASEVIDQLKARAAELFAPADAEGAIDVLPLLEKPAAAKAIEGALKAIARKHVEAVEPERVALGPPESAPAGSRLFSMRF